jgi:hypothetical protein
VHHKDLKGSSKSFSWTEVGESMAAARAMVQVWAWEQQVSGALCPLPPEMLVLARS